jgi:hypothetical protein
VCVCVCVCVNGARTRTRLPPLSIKLNIGRMSGTDMCLLQCRQRTDLAEVCNRSLDTRVEVRGRDVQ